MAIVAEWVKPVVFTVPYFDIPIYAYGLFLGLAFVVCFLIADREAKRLNIKSEPATGILVAMAGGIVGAKMHYALTWDFEGLYTLSNGLSFQGGALGGALACAFYFWWNGDNILDLIDKCAPLLAIGHAVGKLGCFFSGDGCYGVEASPTLPWAMSFPNGLEPTRRFVHPVPLYEFITSFSIFLFAWRRRNVATALGDQSTFVIISMSLSRVLIERWRRHKALSAGYLLGMPLNQYQLFALVAAVVGLVVRVVLLRRLKKVSEQPPKKVARVSNGKKQGEESKKKK